MGNTDDFRGFDKIPRLNRDCLITEKIDGTNAQIYIGEDGTFKIGSRKRWITPEKDNFGFAKWAYEHEEELRQLGPGRHFGEWWGQGIQRNYGLDERRFSLFNVGRWTENSEDEPDKTAVPSCCHVVPILYEGLFTTERVQNVLVALEIDGSLAAPGYREPEGIVVYHKAGGHLYKVTFDGDGHKGDK